MSQAQEWARRRNHNIFRLRGAAKAIKTIANADTTTLLEHYALMSILKHITRVIHDWPNNNSTSKEMYLK